MGGIFSKQNRPKLEGAYFNFETQPQSPLPISPGTTVAVAFKHSWGPSGETVRVRSFAEFQAIFGPDDDTDGYLAARLAFTGEGVEGRNGAGELVCYRFEGSGAKAAVITVKNTAGEPANALPLQAKYKGTYGNNLSVEVVDVSEGVDRLIVKLNGVEVERYTYDETDITALGEAITAKSDWLELAGAVVSGTALDKTTDGALTEGNDGTTGTEDWSGALEALDVEQFAIFSAHGLTDEGIIASVKQWVVESNENGHRIFAALGEASGTTLEKAISLAESVASPEILVVDGVTLRDLVNGPEGGSIELGGAQLASRVAGIFAARGEYQSLSAARLANTEIVAGRTLGEMVEAFDGGVITFARDSHATAPVHIKTGLSSWTQEAADADPSRPYLIYRQPKYVRTMHGIETELTQFAEEKIIGLRPIDSATRDAIIAEAKRNLGERQKLSVILPGWTVGIDQNPPPTDQDEFIALAMSVTFGRALEQVYFTVSVS